MRDAFLAEHDVHYVRDADFVCDARLRRVNGTHRITYAVSHENEEITVDMQEALYSALMGFVTGGLFEAVDADTYRKEGTDVAAVDTKCAGRH